jgi:putative tryptophan/tyrosine transport system substrate-binding protein
MRRRNFITLLGGTVAWPLSAARAQQPATQQRIAIFHPAIPTTLITETGGGSAWRAFFAELRRLGYIEGENLIIERYSAEGHHERYADLAREIVTRNPDLIVTGTNPVGPAFSGSSMNATTGIVLVASRGLGLFPHWLELLRSVRGSLGGQRRWSGVTPT